MYSFAGREPRDTISFYLENEANGQPGKKSNENNDISTNPEAINPNAAQETAGIDPIEGAIASTQQPSHQTAVHELLPSSIEIIEDGASQTSSIHESTDGTKVDLLTTRDPASQPPHSPDNSPF